MMKSLGSAWFGLFQRVERTLATRMDGAVARHSAESLVVLPDGALMYVRHASLAAAERRPREGQRIHALSETIR